jgi:hypothetical protein
MAHDVFVSYSKRDKQVADAVVAGLERRGIRCWIAPRDVTPGKTWGQEIVRAIADSKIMVMILSEAANKSSQVVREVERAANEEVIIIPFRIDNIDPTGDIAYFLSTTHWLDALTPPLESHIDQLGKTIQAFLSEGGSEVIEDLLRSPARVTQPEKMTSVQDLSKPDQKATHRKKDWMAFVALGLGIVSMCGWLLPICGFPFVIGGIVFGILGLKSSKRVISIIGLILSGLALILLVLNMILGMAMSLSDPDFFETLWEISKVC